MWVLKTTRLLNGLIATMKMVLKMHLTCNRAVLQHLLVKTTVKDHQEQEPIWAPVRRGEQNVLITTETLYDLIICLSKINAY